jgi:poly-gamma-glutamate system protein
MRLRQGKVNRWVLVGLAAVALLCFFTVTRTMHTVRSRQFDAKLAAAQLAQQALQAAGEYRLEAGVPIDSVNDPNGTGLVGLQYSLLTYGRSDLSDALTTTNPNFAAALVELLGRAGAHAGDTIAVSWDGTYPALNIELLAAAQATKLEPIIVSVQSAASWGANYPGYSWLDIERMLGRDGVWDYRSRMATLGGDDDNGRGLSPEGRASLAAAAESAGVALLAASSLDDAIQQRLRAYGRPKVFVSIGRAVADIGDPLAKVPSRLIADRTRHNQYKGLIGAMRQRGVPVIHIANPSQVAVEYRLPVAPVPLPELGKGRLFFERRYSVPLAALFALLVAALLLVVVRYDVESYLGVKREDAEKEAV